MNKFNGILSIFLLITVTSLCSCTDDDTFGTSPNNTLSFSKDTVKLDTVFSRIPTPTQSFWVYNKSDNGIRCSSIKLRQGNQTGFRVNVDGTYLSEVMGYQISNVEIRKNDSIRVFVELTSPMNGKLLPQELEDDLVFSLESGVEQKINLNAWSWDAEILNNVKVKDDMTLSSERPIIIMGGITVDSAATLRIPAGQTIFFHSGAGIDVYGQLLCEGEETRNVVLRGDRIDRMFDYLPYDMVSGQWKGIHFHESSYNNSIAYTDIHSTFDGIVCDSSDVSREKLEMVGSVVHNCQGDGLNLRNSYVKLYNCQITNTLGDCIKAVGGSVIIQHCTLAQFYPFDSQRGVALYFKNEERSPMTLYCLNSLITGASEDVITGQQNDSTELFDYYFVSSLLRTPVVEDTVRFKDIVWENPSDTLLAGKKHFKLVDMSTQHFDFHLDSISPAIGKANPIYALPKDREGKSRDTAPDMGCYEF